MLNYVRLEILTAVRVMLMMILWVVTPCRLVDTYVREKHTISFFRSEVAMLGNVSTYTRRHNPEERHRRRRENLKSE
jgi:hypothetical protein